MNKNSFNICLKFNIDYYNELGDDKFEITDYIFTDKETIELTVNGIGDFC
ncbi:MAG: hypothetical protein IH795_01955 [Bacteroidetes bacterium]|nr:hypothetical protein [Bacteroidota bacterium]